jgi:hypothetical protein
MPYTTRSRSSTILGSPATSAETAICTVGALSLTAGDVVDLDCSIDITIGTSGVTLTLKLERGAVAGGTIIATWGPATVVATSRYVLGVNASDVQAAELYGQAYVLTATVGSGAATSTVNAVYMLVMY